MADGDAELAPCAARKSEKNSGDDARGKRNRFGSADPRQRRRTDREVRRETRTRMGRLRHRHQHGLPGQKSVEPQLRSRAHGRCRLRRRSRAHDREEHDVAGVGEVAALRIRCSSETSGIHCGCSAKRLRKPSAVSLSTGTGGSPAMDCMGRFSGSKISLDKTIS